MVELLTLLLWFSKIWTGHFQANRSMDRRQDSYLKLFWEAFAVAGWFWCWDRGKDFCSLWWDQLCMKFLDCNRDCFRIGQHLENALWNYLHFGVVFTSEWKYCNSCCWLVFSLVFSLVFRLIETLVSHGVLPVHLRDCSIWNQRMCGSITLWQELHAWIVIIHAWIVIIL